MAVGPLAQVGKTEAFELIKALSLGRRHRRAEVRPRVSRMWGGRGAFVSIHFTAVGETEGGETLVWARGVVIFFGGGRTEQHCRACCVRLMLGFEGLQDLAAETMYLFASTVCRETWAFCETCEMLLLVCI